METLPEGRDLEAAARREAAEADSLASPLIPNHAI
jgi:hypothetical protein